VGPAHDPAAKMHRHFFKSFYTSEPVLLSSSAQWTRNPAGVTVYGSDPPAPRIEKHRRILVTFFV
jgi:hypothetical protein